MNLVAVMYLGMVCELAPAAELFQAPMHPYTQALLSAIPVLGELKPKHIQLRGEVPTPINLPSGCVFHGRCLYAKGECSEHVPQLREVKKDHFAACFLL